MRSPRCPLCDAPIEGDDALRDHLAVVHDLLDDPGTTTRLYDLDPMIVPTDEVETSPAVMPDPPTMRVYEPDAADDRWRPLVVGVGGVVLLAAVAVAKAAMGA